MARQDGLKLYLNLRPCVLAVAMMFVSTTVVSAQQPTQSPEGYSRIQGLTGNAPALPAPIQTGPILDFREELRTLVQRISTYARSQNNRFMVITRDAGELLIKRDLQDEKIISPARTFMRSIDAVMFDSVFIGYQMVGQVPPPEIQQISMARIERAKRSGLPILTMDFAEKPSEITQVYQHASKQNFISMVAHRPLPDLTELPPYPSRPNAENSNNIVSLKNVKNFTYITDPAAWGRQDEFALAIHDTNFDLVIVDPFSGRAPLSRTAVETLKYKKLGARRLVFARMDLGTIASYRYYWKPEWREGSPLWIAAPYPGDPDRYFAEYWRPGFQDVMFGNEQSYLFGVIKQGYDGVLLEGLNTYLAFEGNVEIPEAFAPLKYPAN